jgi:hypothetical protein
VSICCPTTLIAALCLHLLSINATCCTCVHLLSVNTSCCQAPARSCKATDAQRHMPSFPVATTPGAPAACIHTLCTCITQKAHHI